MTTSEDLFTAAQIARALGCSKQNVHQRLAYVPADGEQMLTGNLTKFWRVSSLPPMIVRELCEKSEAKRYRSVADLLSNPFVRYQTAIPLPEIAPAAIDRARQLRTALEPILPLRNSLSITAEELAERGVETYKRVFGHGVTTRHWRTLLDRTLERDNGAEEWHRLDIYVEENPPRISSRKPISIARDRGLEVVESVLTGLAGRSSLSANERVYLWVKACDELDMQLADRAPEKKTKRAIIKVLVASGLLGKDSETIRRTFNRKWAEYRAAGNLVDRRTKRDQQRELPDSDLKKLVARSLDCGGRTRQAFRELRDAGELSEETLARTIANPRNKSHIPASINRQIAPEVRRLMPLHRGEREFELRGPYIPQDHTQIAAGQVMQLDDVTLPVWYWETDPEAPGGIFFGRGQWILCIDVRSRMALGHALHSSPQYNMRIVRSLLLSVHDEYGLPETLLLERGMWRTAKVIKGDELDISHTEMGLREFGVTFQHRTKPRGKIIERIIGLLQNQMERIPGYVGRDERHDRFERTQELIRDVKAGREHPSKFFLSKTQWLEQVDGIITRYNRERQEGKMCCTPIEAWNANLLPQGTVNLGDKVRYLLAHHKKRVKVQPRGIQLAAGLGGGLYYNHVTGRFAGQEMLAWINPDELEAITLTSLDRREGPYVVERANALSPIGASDAELARAQAQVAEHNSYARAQYRVIHDQLAVRKFRPLWIRDRSTVPLGQRIETATAEARQDRQKKMRLVKSAQDLVRKRRINVRVDAKNAERASVAAKLLGEVYPEET